MGIDRWSEYGIGIYLNKDNAPTALQVNHEAWLDEVAKEEGYTLEDGEDHEEMIDRMLEDYGDEFSEFDYLDHLTKDKPYSVKKYGNFMSGDCIDAILIMDDPFKGGMANLMGNILEFYQFLTDAGYILANGIDDIDIVCGTSIG